MNKKRFVLECISSIYNQIYKNFEIILIDNNSKDGTINAVKKQFPKTKIIETGANIGLTKGQALGYKHTNPKSKYLLFLNDDTIADKNWLSELVKTMESDEKIGACQPKVLSAINKGYFDYTGAAGGYMDIYGYPYCRGRVFNEIEKDTSQYNDQTEVFWSSGGSIITRKNLVDRFGYYSDPDFFIYAEEIDYCWRLHLLGYKMFCNPKAIIYHYGGLTTSKKDVKMPMRMAFLLHRNHFIMLLKNYSFKTLLRIIPTKLLLEFIAIAGFLIKDPSRSLAILWSLLWLKTHPLNLYKKHKHTQSFRKIPDKEIQKKMLKKSIAIGYWLFNKKHFKNYGTGFSD